jgi:uncharacterized protein YndB with AHSA1/START domain
MSSTSVHHDTFVIERTYPSPPSRVFRALTDPAAKAAWFLAPGDWTSSGYRFDCRVGGTEHLESRPPGGEPHVYDAVYHDVVADRRVVFSYDMHLGEQHLSVSLTTIELFPVDGGTRLTFTEQGAFLDGDPASATSRVEGSHFLLDNLGKALAGAEAPAAG